jgi:uncharacterized RDD family membrane protein YckC
MSSDPPSSEVPDGLVGARWWTRAWAALIDIVLFLAALVVPAVIVVVGIALCWDEPSDELVADGTGILLIVVGGLLGLGAFVWGGWLFGYRQGVTGTTPGKRRLGIRLVDVDTGEPPGGAKGVGRWLVPGLVGGVQGVGNVVQLVDYLWPLWDDRNQRLIDKVLRTRVVVEPD